MKISRWIMLTISFAAMLFTGFLGGCGGGGSTAPVVAIVAAPEQVTVDGGRERLIVTWSGVSGATSYNVYYSTATPVNPATASKVANVGSPQTIRDLLDGTRYYAVVTAVGPGGESAISKEISAVPANPAPPLAPLNIHADAGSGQITVRWDAADGATSYNLYYGNSASVSQSSGTKLTGVSSPRVVTPLTSGTTYYVIVTAVNAVGESADSFHASATPSASPPPAAPTNLQAALSPGDPTKVVLTWSASAGATSYNLYYGSSWGVTKATGTAVNNVTSPYTLSGLPLAQAAFFAVTAANATVESSESEQASATPRATAIVAAASRMLSIPAGNFDFGDSSDNVTYAKPVKTINVSAFRIDRYETTYDLWKTVYDWATDPARGANIYNFDNAGLKGSSGMGTDMPVTRVSWYDVVKWLNARSEMEGLTPAYYTDAAHTVVYRTGQLDLSNDRVNWVATGYRLPTETEWEKASRGGLAAKRYPWGDDPADPAQVPVSLANYNMGRTTSVGVYPANGLGLYDMAGNVWEWTWNWWVADYNHASIVVNDPVGPDTPISATDILRVRRGGGIAYGPAYLRNAERVGRVPTYTAPYFGFRSVRSGN